MAETVAFLFVDLEGSTRLLAAVGSESYGELLTAYREVVAEAARAEGGEVVDREGDGIFLVLPTAAGAVRAAARAQRALSGRRWPGGAEPSARMGVHAGEVERHDDGYVGLDVHRAARVADAAWGGQILVSEAARALAADGLPDGSSFRDLGEHRMKGLERTEHLHQLVGPGLADGFPSLRTLEAAPNNLPTQPTRFVGREEELAEVIGLVRDHRLVTVTGVGGSGKTRVALQAVAELIDELPDGAWLVELGAVSDPDLVDGVLLDALGLPQPSRVSAREAAIERLADASAVLVVDNCEHLIGAAADLVAAILNGTSDCAVVATSREVLGAPGEVVYGLRSMRLPPRGDEADVEAVAVADAVRLFVERAAEVDPHFQLTADNASAVAEICRRLDGMPLALELAAARLRAFGPGKLAELLDQRFRLLTGGSRTALPRQQTLEATIEWSYRLLDERERALFRRLSVFQGGFSYDAVVTVCAGDGIDDLDVLELLPALVDKSLVVVEDEGGIGGGEVRYRLLETLRQFARDRLEESGEGEAVRGRHVSYFHELVVEAEPHMLGPEERARRRWFEREADNLRQAITVALGSDDPVTALGIAVRFAAFARRVIGWSEAISWVERTLAAGGDEAGDLLRAKALLTHASLLDESSEQERAIETAERAVELFRELAAGGAAPEELRGPLGYPGALIALAVILFHQGRIGADNEVFTEIVSEALEIARGLDDRFGVASALGNLAHHRDPGGDVHVARRRFEEALDAWRAVGSERGLAIVSQQRAFFEFAVGDLEASREAWEAAVRHAERGAFDTRDVLAWGAVLAAVEVELGDRTGAERFVSAVRDLFARPETGGGTAFHQSLLVVRAGIDAALGRYERVAIGAGASAAETERGRPIRWDLADHFDRTTAAAREELGEEAFESAAARGRAMSDDDVVAHLVAD